MNPERKKLTDHESSMAESKIVKMNYPQPDADEMEIDLIDLTFHLLDKAHYIILSLLFGAVLLNVFSYLFIHPTYQSESKLYVVSSSEDSVVNLSDLNIGSSLTKDYEELILSYPLLEQVIDELDLEISYKNLVEMITLTNPSNTRILCITVESENPYLSRDIANAVAEISAEYLPETMSTMAPNIAQKAQLAESKSGPSYLKYTMIGALLGMLVCCGIFVLQYLMDDTIHTSEDMEKYFGIVPLTAIPDSDLFEEGRTGKTKKK